MATGVRVHDFQKDLVVSDEPTCEISVNEPVYIEITLQEHKQRKSSICRMWDRVRHRRTDEANTEFLRFHPECEDYDM